MTAACGICTSVRPCDRSGGKASIILVSVLQLLLNKVRGNITKVDFDDFREYTF